MTDPTPDLDELESLHAEYSEVCASGRKDEEAHLAKHEYESALVAAAPWLIARAREAMAALELLASIAQVADDGADCPCCEMTVAEDGYVHDAECPVPKYRLAADARRTP